VSAGLILEVFAVWRARGGEDILDIVCKWNVCYNLYRYKEGSRKDMNYNLFITD